MLRARQVQAVCERSKTSLGEKKNVNEHKTPDPGALVKGWTLPAVVEEAEDPLSESKILGISQGISASP